LSPDATRAISEDVLVFDGHDGNDTCEGAKFHKSNGYYYIFFPAGGVKDGWQMVARSRSVYGPYEYRRVMDKGKSILNGPHQGAWVRTPQGEDWFFHFQEKKPLGRVVHLQPMKWINEWPVIGIDKDGDGCGEPVTTYTKPKTDYKVPVVNPAESDEFNGYSLGLQWQWYANPKPAWAFFHGEKGFIRLFSENPNADYKNLLNTPNLLLQKFPAPDFTATAKVRFCQNPESKGEKCGLGIIGMDYATLSIEKVDSSFILSQITCTKAEKGNAETVNESVILGTDEVYLRVKVNDIKDCAFSYSIDGKTFKNIGTHFTAREGVWIGAKVGFFCTRAEKKNDGGWMDVDWFRISK
jgi:beta-xylosidase